MHFLRDVRRGEIDHDHFGVLGLLHLDALLQVAVDLLSQELVAHYQQEEAVFADLEFLDELVVLLRQLLSDLLGQRGLVGELLGELGVLGLELLVQLIGEG